VTATNHALTGAIIGLAVGQPFIALPAAILSHFVCDALPHYGSSMPNELYFKTRKFRLLLLADACLCIILVGFLLYFHPHHWLLASVCAFFATSPDLVWIHHYLLVRADKPWHPNLYSRFAARIQWFERPIGALVEAAWAAAGIVILSLLIHA
jgi:hypothetical protein